MLGSVLRFNPRTREGCDNDPHFHLSAAPCFNPRTREGCDDEMTLTKARLDLMFQSTHPRGVRRCGR